MSATVANPTWIASEKTFTITTWTLCAVAILFLASRFSIRISTKGRLMVNDYFLVAAVPLLLAGFALLQSVIHQLYRIEARTTEHNTLWSQPANAPRRLVAAVELIWITIYCVKFCYLASFKFYKAPYAYVDRSLTRFYWTAIGCCAVGFLFTIVQPIVLCAAGEHCRYVDGLSAMPWEIVVTVIDMVTDILVIMIPILLICMASTVRSYTISNFAFKSLSLFNIVVAATRLALQYDATSGRVRYISVTFLLVIEATIALIMAGISGYRVVFSDYLVEWERAKANVVPTHLAVRPGGLPTQTAAGGGADDANPSQPQHGSLSKLPILSTG